MLKLSSTANNLNTKRKLNANYTLHKLGEATYSRYACNLIHSALRK